MADRVVVLPRLVSCRVFSSHLVPARRIPSRLRRAACRILIENRVPGRRPGRPEIVRISTLGPSCVTQEVPEMSRECLGASLDRPGTAQESRRSGQGRSGRQKRAAERTRDRAEATKIDAKLRPRAKKARFFHATRSQSMLRKNRRQLLPIFRIFAKHANRLKYRACY